MKPKNSSHIPELDGIRGLAISLVLFWHYYVATMHPQMPFHLYLSARAFSLAWSGVDLFFVLSGFLIGGILLDNRHSPSYFKTFYVRRILRIFPLYYVVVFLFLLVTATGIFAGSKNMSNFLQNTIPIWTYLTYTQNFAMTLVGNSGSQWLAMTWSLAVEEQFYLVLPFIIYYFNERRLPFVLLTLIAIAPLIRIAIILFFPQYAYGTYWLMPARMDSLFLGVVCAYALRQPETVATLTKQKQFLGIAFLFLGVGVIWLTSQNPIRATTLPIATYGYTWLALFYTTFLLLCLIVPTSWPARLARLRPLRQLGIITYGVYIFHQAVNALFHDWFLHQTPQLLTLTDLGVTLLSLLMTFALAYVSWHYFEKYLVQRGHTFQY